MQVGISQLAMCIADTRRLLIPYNYVPWLIRQAKRMTKYRMTTCFHLWGSVGEEPVRTDFLDSHRTDWTIQVMDCFSSVQQPWCSFLFNQTNSSAFASICSPGVSLTVQQQKEENLRPGFISLLVLSQQILWEQCPLFREKRKKEKGSEPFKIPTSRATSTSPFSFSSRCSSHILLYQQHIAHFSCRAACPQHYSFSSPEEPF